MSTQQNPVQTQTYLPGYDWDVLIETPGIELQLNYPYALNVGSISGFLTILNQLFSANYVSKAIMADPYQLNSVGCQFSRPVPMVQMTNNKTGKIAIINPGVMSFSFFGVNAIYENGSDVVSGQGGSYVKYPDYSLALSMFTQGINSQLVVQGAN